MILQTKRLIIREALLDDAPFFIELMNTKGWIENIGDRNIHKTEDAKVYIKDSLLFSYQTNGFGLYVMEEISSKSAIGIAGLVKRETLNSPDLGFAILPEAEGNGFAFEACRKILGTVNALGYKEILAITTPTNIRSKKLLMKLGFKRITEDRDVSKHESLNTYLISI